MNGGHKTLNHTELVVDNLSDRSQAVGGARCVRNDVLTCVGVGVYTANEHRGVVFRRSRHNYIFSTCVDVSLSFLFGQEKTCRLNYILSLNLVPFEVCGVALCGHADSVAVYYEFAVNNLNGAVEFAVYAIVFEHVSHVLNIDEVVDTNNLKFVCLVASSTEYQTTDTTKAVDTNLNLCHNSLLIKVLLYCMFFFSHYKSTNFRSFTKSIIKIF